MAFLATRAKLVACRGDACNSIDVPEAAAAAAASNTASASCLTSLVAVVHTIKLFI